MPVSRKIKENLRAVSAIETITATYREISQKEMNEIRGMALKNRNFIQELSRVCAMAKKSCFVDEKGIEEKIFDKKKDRVFIFFSANARFYGTLILEVWRKVIDHLNKEKGDLIVVGEVGKNIVEKTNFKKKFFYFELNDDKPKEQEIKKIIDFIKDYKEIIAFHGMFKTILSQEVVQSFVSKEISTEDVKEDVTSYLFEPSPEEVLRFFEKELIRAFFNQTFLEHRLSRHATRMVAMHHAVENAKERKEKLDGQIKKNKKRMMDKKQLEITIPYQLWK